MHGLWQLSGCVVHCSIGGVWQRHRFAHPPTHAVQALVERFDCVEVEGLTPDGAPLRLTARGWQARIFQHEVDHLHVSRGVCPRALAVYLHCCWPSW